jgi:hypothetical protein
VGWEFTRVIFYFVRVFSVKRRAAALGMIGRQLNTWTGQIGVKFIVL